MGEPLGRLAYLYVGVDELEATLAYYREVIGAERVWHFSRFGTQVAAVRLGEGPLWLLAEHRTAGSVLPVFAVADLDATVEALTGRGWRADEGPFDIPDGPCYTFSDPAGNQLAICGDLRPGHMQKSYDDPDNEFAVRD